jgi:hypothetical protein
MQLPTLSPRRLAGAAALACAAALISLSTAAGTGALAQSSSATVPRCTTSQLEVWLGLGAGEETAGSTYYPMEFTNVSGNTCYLYGFPGVSAWTTHQVGSPAKWVQPSLKSTVTLRPGATAHTVLQIADVSNFPHSECVPVTATGPRVIPPGAFTSTFIPFRFRACSVVGTIFMFVRPIQPRLGVPGH